jgi:hypothetical protein
VLAVPLEQLIRVHIVIARELCDRRPGHQRLFHQGSLPRGIESAASLRCRRGRHYGFKIQDQASAKNKRAPIGPAIRSILSLVSRRVYTVQTVRTWTPRCAKLAVHDGSKEKIAPVHSDFLLRDELAVPDGFCWLAPRSVTRTPGASYGTGCVAVSEFTCGAS